MTLHTSRNLLCPLAGLVSAALLLAACGGDETTTSTPASSKAGSSAGVLCDYKVSVFNSSASVKATSTSAWSCDSSSRMLVANGLPDHAVGLFPNPDNPNTIAAQTVTATYALAPTVSATATPMGGPRGAVGFVLNGVKLDPGTGGRCTDAGLCDPSGAGGGTWSMEALATTAFKFGTDANNAHVQPDGAYHYHGIPEGFVSAQNKGKAMTLVAWAADGFPIYARYGYSTAGDASSPIKVLAGSYKTKSTPDSGRPSTATYPMGAFLQDWVYVAGSGDLDECNGRTGVTPEFPGGTYYYAMTDTYPFIQRCVKGAVSAAAGGGGAMPPPPGNGMPPPPGV
jgi:hypothetical protein